MHITVICHTINLIMHSPVICQTINLITHSPVICQTINLIIHKIQSSGKSSTIQHTMFSLCQISSQPINLTPCDLLLWHNFLFSEEDHSSLQDLIILVGWQRHVQRRSTATSSVQCKKVSVHSEKHHHIHSRSDNTSRLTVPCTVEIHCYKFSSVQEGICALNNTAKNTYALHSISQQFP